ncbi:MAG: hypothetical protein ABII02_02005 [Candidatus Magasanikbacteria bacterium]
MKFILGAIGIVIGTFFVIKTEWFIRNFGTNAWAEQHMGTSGGTRLFYKLFGLVVIILSILSITGLLGGLVLAVLTPLFGGFGQ